MVEMRCEEKKKTFKFDWDILRCWDWDFFMGKNVANGSQNPEKSHKNARKWSFFFFRKCISNIDVLGIYIKEVYEVYL